MKYEFFATKYSFNRDTPQIYTHEWAEDTALTCNLDFIKCKRCGVGAWKAANWERYQLDYDAYRFTCDEVIMQRVLT